jgi:hypothetical protein
MRISLILPVFLLFVNVGLAGKVRKPDLVAPYNCLKNSISGTKQQDLDSNNVFDTYTIQACDGSTNISYPLVGSDKLKDWPPKGGPIPSIVYDGSGSTPVFQETWYDNSGAITAYFVKSINDDTVRFYSADEQVTLSNFTLDSSWYYLKVSPNPASCIINIQYVVNSSGSISLDLYTSMGQYVATILQAHSPQGDFIAAFDISPYNAGNYIVKYTIGRNVYSVNLVITR